MNALLKGTLIVILAAAGVPAVAAEPPAKTPPAKPAAPRSVFLMPVSAREGRDPFFPDSTRVYEENPASQQHVVDENSFAVKGLSYEHGHTMVIINNHTFALGDEGDVLTTSGRVHIRLAEIRSTSVVIEVNGSRRELTTAIK
jgi:hypothetical protein